MWLVNRLRPQNNWYTFRSGVGFQFFFNYFFSNGVFGQKINIITLWIDSYEKRIISGNNSIINHSRCSLEKNKILLPPSHCCI
jgi:hypothetical protein